MPPAKPLTIAPTPPEQVTLNFAKLLQEGLSEVQNLAHDVWTDYNEHDPGVTTLEALCYGLTDLAYRTAHPIEDILSSSAQVTGVAPNQQPLFTGDNILTNAPQTENDFRKLAYDAVPGLRNLWMHPISVPDVAQRGLYHVYVQAYSSSQNASLAEPGPPGKTDRLLQKVQELLNANRNLGQDFAEISMIPSQEVALDVTLTIAPDQSVETVLAQMLYRIEDEMNPAPVLRDVGVDLNAGISPTEIFQGPRLTHGWISDDSLAPLGINLNQEAVLYAINNTPGIGDVGPLNVSPVGEIKPQTSLSGRPQGSGAPMIYVLSRRVPDLKRIKVFRNGDALEPDMSQVLARWHHLEEQARWSAGYASRNVQQLDYARLPQGNARRALGRYRSIQHLFPGIYGLGAQGAPQGIIPAYQREMGSRANRDAARNQLKAYLLFFEQQLTNYLAQLNNSSLLLSFAPQDVTYHTQPLIDPRFPDPDAPPEIAAVLGAQDGTDQTKKQDWYDRYTQGIETLSKAHDPVAERIARTLDAFLARFNEAFPDATLRRIRDVGTMPPARFEHWLNARKRDYLYRLVPITSRRGMGLNLGEQRETVPLPNMAPGHRPEAPAIPKTRPQLIALEEAVRAKTGHEGTLAVVEHLLLRNFSLCNFIPNLEIANTFLIQPLEPVHAVRFGDKTIRLHLLLETGVPGSQWPSLAARIVALGADRLHYRRSSPSGYTVQVRLCDATGFGLHLLEEFASHHDAKQTIARMVTHFQALLNGTPCVNEWLCPAAVPLGFFSLRASVFLSDVDNPHASQENRNLIESVVTERMPAHLAHRCYWLDEHDTDRFNALHANWIGALLPLYQGVFRTEACAIRATQAARSLRTMVQEYYVRDLIASRGPAGKHTLENIAERAADQITDPGMQPL